MAWTAVADVPFVPVGAIYFSQIIGAEFYMIDRGFNFYKCNIGTGVWTQLANPPFIGTGLYRSLTYRNGMLYCIDEGAGAEPSGRRISWYNIATGVWASSSQVPGLVFFYRNIKSFCFADDDTIWAWVKRNAFSQMKCVRYVISTDTWTEFPNDTGVLAVNQARCAAINAAGTIVYCGHQGVAAGCYGSYTIATDAYVQSSPYTGWSYCYAHDPQRLWYARTVGALADRRYGYFDIETLTYHDNYWSAGPPTRSSIYYLGSNLQAIVDEAQAIAGANPYVWWDGEILSLPTVTTDPATSVEQTSATPNGTLDDDGSEACDVRFQYGETTDYGLNTAWQTGKVTGDTFAQVVRALRPGGIVYHFRAQARNSAGTVNGDDRTFQTTALSAEAHQALGRSHPLGRAEV